MYWRTRVKNPCKICQKSVTNKTGLQCKGHCHKWTHYNCLDYTQGKIQDIKAGIIKITCPCPNCNTNTHKGDLRNYPSSDKEDIPVNILQYDKIVQCLTEKRSSNKQEDKPPGSPQRAKCSPCLVKCDKALLCSEKTPDTPEKNVCPLCLAKCKSPPSSPKRKKSVSDSLKPLNKVPSQSCCQKSPASNESLACPVEPCEEGTSEELNNGSPPKDICPPPPSEPTLCSPCALKTVSLPPSCDELDKGFNMPSNCGSIQSKSCSCLACCDSNKQLRAVWSDTEASANTERQKILITAIEQLCTTVGLLSYQIKELLCKMMTNLEKPNDQAFL